MMVVLTAMGLGAVPGLAALALGQWQQRRRRRLALQQRLAGIAPVATAPRLLRARVQQWGEAVLATPLVPDAERRRWRQTLYAAGWPQAGALTAYLGGKLALLLGLQVGALLWVLLAAPGVLLAALVHLTLAVLAWMGPDRLLAGRATSRRQAIDRGLPDALDLLVVCGEAGIGLEQAMERVARELRPVHPALAAELAVTVSDMRLLPDRLQGLANMAERVQLESMRNIATTLAQTLRYGTPLGRALRTITADLRLVRQTALEAQAARLPVLMTLPMIAFILPATGLVVAGPAFLQLIDALGRMHG